MNEALEEHEGIISNEGRNITNIRFVDDIDSFMGGEEDIASLVENLDGASTTFGMEVSAKQKEMTSNNNTITTDIYTS